jgi:polar amino acid transport system substrate-binding protein
MRHCRVLGLLLVLLTIPAAPTAAEIAADDILRAVYLRTNPAQAIRDPVTGEVRGTSAILAAELARRNNLSLDFKAVSGPPDVIEAVRGGEANIGFVAYEATRVGTVEFSQTYMLVRQSFVVPDGSPVRAVAQVDRAGHKVGGLRNDSITLCMKRIFKQATVIELESQAVVGEQLASGDIDAFGANRQTLTNLSKGVPATRLLPDDLFFVPQTIIVPMGKPAALSAVNAFIDEVRASGFLRSAIENGGAIGVLPAPAGDQRYGCPG